MKAIVCVGISGSGKSTFAEKFVKEQTSWVEINRDNVRFSEFCNGERNWGKYRWKNEKKVTDICNSQIEKAAECKYNIIVSDTNLNPKYRTHLIYKLEQLGYEIEIKSFDIDLEEAYKRDKLRPNSVGQEVIYKQYLQYLEYKGFQKYTPDTFLKDCVIVDVDGTVAKKCNRSPFDWDRVSEDYPISTVMDIVDGLHERGYSVVFLSGRDSCCYKDTQEWLQKYFNFDIELYMRKAGDMRKDYIVKRELFWENVAHKYNVRMAIDDRLQVLEQVWTPLGIKTIAVGRTNDRF